jgi:DNA-binding NarL/FixJ family response regulator
VLRETGAKEVTSLFIVAASDVVRAGLESLTLNDARLTVVGTAADLGELARRIAEGLLPDVVIMVAEGQPFWGAEQYAT